MQFTENAVETKIFFFFFNIRQPKIIFDVVVARDIEELKSVVGSREVKK